MTAQMEKVLAALMTNPDRKSAAKAAGVTDRTLRRYFKDPEFSEQYRLLYTEILQDAAAEGKQLLHQALQTFRDVMGNSEESAATRVTAARSAIEYALRLSEQTDIVADIAELKKAVFADESKY